MVFKPHLVALVVVNLQVVLPLVIFKVVKAQQVKVTLVELVELTLLTTMLAAVAVQVLLD
jgi:hypothetical protein